MKIVRKMSDNNNMNNKIVDYNTCTVHTYHSIGTPS